MRTFSVYDRCAPEGTAAGWSSPSMNACSEPWSVMRPQPSAPQTSTRVNSLAAAAAGRARARTTAAIARRMASGLHRRAPRGSRRLELLAQHPEDAADDLVLQRLALPGAQEVGD